MKSDNLKRIAHAHETAIAQLDLAAIAVRSAGAGLPFALPTTDSEVQNVMKVRDDLAQRLKDLVAVPAGIM